jgi:spermidine synthase
MAPAWLVPLLAALLFLSGAAALVYQVLWLRLLALTFGVTTQAASTVLAAFMGGLALGSFLAGRLADRVRNPLRLFGFVELAIGVCALASPFALSTVHTLAVALFARLPDSVVLGTVTRLVLAFAVLLVPTALMGATLPIVVKSSRSRIDRLGARIGLLYAVNTAGAILGVLLAGFYLIPQIGLSGSFLIAASFNGVAGLAAVLCAPKWPVTSNEAATAPPADAPIGAGSSAVPNLVLAAFAISGFASLALEVIWFRVLVVFLGPTTYAFTVMLASVLAGIALGSAIMTPMMRLRTNWLLVLAGLQAAAAIVAVRSFLPLRRAPALPEWAESLFRGGGWEMLIPFAAASVWAILPAAIFMGLAFPVGLRLWTAMSGDERHTAERIGVFYSVNVCGGIAGSILAGFVMLPSLGSRGSLIAVTALFLFSGLLLVVTSFKRKPLVALVALALVAVFVNEARTVPDLGEAARRRRYHGGAIEWEEEGAQTTVSVVGTSGNRVLYLDGQHQASDSGTMVFVHSRIGLLPAALHPQPKRALVVGLGGGVTPGALSQWPGIDIDVVELSGSVIRAAPYFSHVNFNLLERPNVRLRQDDGRNYLLRTRTPYDVITADAIIPSHVGAANLYSKEYFQLVRGALAPDGVALHWNGGGSAVEYKMILSGFFETFPNATLWGDGTLMVGTKQPLHVSRGRVEALLANPDTRRALALMNVTEAEHLVKMFRARPEEIRGYLAGAEPLSDDKPAIEYFASLAQEERDLTVIPRITDGVIEP